MDICPIHNFPIYIYAFPLMNVVTMSIQSFVTTHSLIPVSREYFFKISRNSEELASEFLKNLERNTSSVLYALVIYLTGSNLQPHNIVLYQLSNSTSYTYKRLSDLDNTLMVSC